jgi:hypothetical protein
MDMDMEMDKIKESRSQGRGLCAVAHHFQLCRARCVCAEGRREMDGECGCVVSEPSLSMPRSGAQHSGRGCSKAQTSAEKIVTVGAKAPELFG